MCRGQVYSYSAGLTLKNVPTDDCGTMIAHFVCVQGVRTFIQHNIHAKHTRRYVAMILGPRLYASYTYTTYMNIYTVHLICKSICQNVPADTSWWLWDHGRTLRGMATPCLRHLGWALLTAADYPDNINIQKNHIHVCIRTYIHTYTRIRISIYMYVCITYIYT